MTFTIPQITLKRYPHLKTPKNRKSQLTPKKSNLPYLTHNDTCKAFFFTIEWAMLYKGA
jgi:hypothetical protein